MKKVLLVLLCIVSVHLYGHEVWHPQANPGAVIQEGPVRFTILSPDLIRMEWDSTGHFTDEASFFVVNRALPVPTYKKKESRTLLDINTGKLELKYHKGTGKFTASNLEIIYQDGKKKNIWHPGQKNTGNLKGTYRTLDGCRGQYFEGTKTPIPMEDGLLSTEGWTLIDDTNSYLMDGSDWSWVTPRSNQKSQDWYFISYGKNYKKALYEYTKIGGKVPLPPRYAFGYWWSRYWNYSDNELRDLVKNFNHYQIPLDVLVIDMDWHQTKGLNKVDEFGQVAGWTGYTWERSLFPEPGKFLAWIKQQNLKVTLNLHPASGVPSDESQYNSFAQAMHADSTTHKPIPFEVADKPYMSNLFNVILHPMEKAGVSFWWLDWQQWPNSKKYTGLSNTWWLNYCFYTDMERQNTQRPILYHRWGGLGNHRYQIGFSGDAIISWESLDYQPYFTTTASNVLYGYWSHDLGGHFFGNTPADQCKINPELYIRWMQFGALSPIFRTHSTKDSRIIKEVWNFPHEYSSQLCDIIDFRYALVPYIYTMARKDYETGISLCRPMYYDYPDNKESYANKNEYMFGDNLLVQPITSPSQGGISTIKVWLPGGNDWYEWNTGTMLQGGQTLERHFLLNEYPLYVKAGSIIPLYPKMRNLQQATQDLIVSIFPGKNSEFKLYEDAGNDTGYEKGEYSYTTMKSEKNQDGGTKITIAPREGYYPGMPTTRNYDLQLHGTRIPEEIKVNGTPIDYSAETKNKSWNYQGSDLTLHINLVAYPCSEPLEIEIRYPKSSGLDQNGLLGKMNRLRQATTYLKNNWNRGDALPPIISTMDQIDRQINYHPEHFDELIEMFNTNYPKLPEEIRKTPVSKETIEKCLNYFQ